MDLAPDYEGRHRMPDGPWNDPPEWVKDRAERYQPQHAIRPNSWHYLCRPYPGDRRSQ